MVSRNFRIAYSFKGGEPPPTQKKIEVCKLKNFLQRLMENYTWLCSSIASQHIPKVTTEGSF